MPVEPPASRWSLPDVGSAQPQEDLLALGADLAPGTVLAAYRAGLFPMGVGGGGAEPIGWWSPDPRGVLLPGQMRVSRSLRRASARFEVSIDAAFDEVLRGCANPSREGRWITASIATAYGELYRLGWAHSIEVWSNGRLAGGLYGLALGGLFAGESMFHRVTDASKVALLELTRFAFADGDPRRVIDVQWMTPHLASLGVREVRRRRYLDLLADALPVTEPTWVGGTPSPEPPRRDRSGWQE